MTRDSLSWDDADDLDDVLHPSLISRFTRQHRTSGPKHSPRRAAAQPDEAADALGSGDDFETTYTPARFEKVWLRESLRPFFAQELIGDVLAQIKGGKEANVYRCQAHPATGRTWLAAKVYRPKRFRNLSNDSLYREGRSILGADGQPIKQADNRVQRALRKKTAFGAEVKHASWLMHEYGILQRLHRAGVAAPEPLAAGDNAILMSYHGDGRMAAPTLNTVSLAPDEAPRLFDEVLRQVDLMLEQELIHGDLSAYNILYWEGTITLIDFPQAINCHVNPYAYTILLRDVTRVCDYFAQQGVATGDPRALTAEVWARHVVVAPDDPVLDRPALP